MQTGSDILAGDAAPAIAKRSRMGDFRTKDIIRTADVRRSNRPYIIVCIYLPFSGGKYTR